MNRVSLRPFGTVALLSVLLLTSCASPRRGQAVPNELADRAVVLGDSSIRSWGLVFNEEFMDELFRAGAREFEHLSNAGHRGPLPTAYYLAISGGGAQGAYGAGLLCGWSETGTRPEFKIVTGISTGALTAPFAFLGSRYDERLRSVYTTVTTRDIARKRGILAAFYDDAMMDTAPLRRLMATVVDEQMMRDIAAEYERGRLLLIGTTNLDASRGVIWNIGAIAGSGDPYALTLIHSILIASASIPAAFPPVMIDVTVDGKKYQEMHVDGGAKAQVFLYPPSLRLEDAAAAEGVVRKRVAYIIRNARLDPEWANVERSTLSIAGRAISSLIQSQGFGDLYRIYLTTQRDGVEFNLAFIPASFNERPTEDFDPVYMAKLFDVGFRAATQPGGYVWQTEPPGFTDDATPGPTPVVAPSRR